MKSERDPGVRRVSATEASRSFSRLLDEVERGRRFLVRRRGEDVCVIAAPPLSGRMASECVLALRNRSPIVLDGGFGADLLDVIGGEPIENRQPWDS